MTPIFFLPLTKNSASHKILDEDLDLDDDLETVLGAVLEAALDADLEPVLDAVLGTVLEADLGADPDLLDDPPGKALAVLFCTSGTPEAPSGSASCPDDDTCTRTALA